MRPRGGYNVSLAGRPSGEVHVLPEADVLYLPLRSRRFAFSDIVVKEGDGVQPGQVLARDPANYSAPLLAPRAGSVRLSEAKEHITLVDVRKEAEEPYRAEEHPEHAPRDMDSSGKKRYKLLALGAWQFFRDAHTGALPDPFGTPSAVIVSTVRLEPYVARGDVQIRKRLSSFTRGLEHLQSLLEYQPIYLVMPSGRSSLARRVRESLRGYAWVQLIELPIRYGLDDLRVLARRLGLRPGDGHAWGLDAAGTLAVDRALTLSRPATVRIVSLGGPAAGSPRHLKAIPGYPLRAILQGCGSSGLVRAINGGALTGEPFPEGQLGLDTECQGITVLPEPREREFLGFVRPGLDRRSYSRCFLSALRRPFAERLTTALRGERRPCISCGFCEEVCPADIMPHLIHKLLYQGAIEEAERARVDLCVGCGLCSFVCPSKIELREELVAAQRTLREEVRGGEETNG